MSLPVEGNAGKDASMTKPGTLEMLAEGEGKEDTEAGEEVGVRVTRRGQNCRLR